MCRSSHVKLRLSSDSYETVLNVAAGYGAKALTNIFSLLAAYQVWGRCSRSIGNSPSPNSTVGSGYSHAPPHLTTGLKVQGAI